MSRLSVIAFVWKRQFFTAVMMNDRQPATPAWSAHEIVSAKKRATTAASTAEIEELFRDFMRACV
jgi:hypothetical protein